MSNPNHRKNPAGHGLALRYVGDGAALVGVPARDLSAAEAQQYDVAALVASGLYESYEEAS